MTFGINELELYNFPLKKLNVAIWKKSGDLSSCAVQEHICDMIIRDLARLVLDLAGTVKQEGKLE